MTPAPASSLAALAAALLADDGTAEWMRAVPRRLETLLAAMPAPARTAVRGATTAIDGYAVARTGRRLSSLGTAERDRLLARLASHRALLPLLDAVKVPVLLAAGTERTLRHGPTPSSPAPDDPPLDCTPSHAWPTRSTADAVVVGAGAGGAMAARTLARAGMRVVIVEEGEHHATASFGRRTPLDRFTDLYRDGGATLALGNPPLVLPVGRAVGGTTVVNSGTCYRTPDHVLSRWTGRHGFAAAEDLDAHLDEVERTLRVATQPLDVLGGNGLLALAGAKKLGWAAAPLRRNAPGCRGSSSCRCSRRRARPARVS